MGTSNRIAIFRFSNSYQTKIEPSEYRSGKAIGLQILDWQNWTSDSPIVLCGIWNIFLPMICSVQLLANRDAKAAAEEDSLQIVKVVIIYFFTALCIEEHYRVPFLVDYALMRFDAFRMEVIELRWAGPLGLRHASF